MSSSFFALDLKGNPLISRSFRGDITHDVSRVFVTRVVDAEEIAIKPVFEHEGFTYCFIRCNDVYLLTVSRINVSPLTQIGFLHKAVQVFVSYFKRVAEETVRDNFVIIYELLDEMLDFGYPQYTEEKVLKEFITQQSLIDVVPQDHLEVNALPASVTGTSGAIEWRKTGIKHRVNEAFLDISESVNVLISQAGETLSSEIIGVFKMRARLSGMPVVKVGLNDRLALEQHTRNQGSGIVSASGGDAATFGKRRAPKTVDLDDIRFHQCVQLNRFEATRAITFIPPDGDFELMTYRLNTRIKPLVVVNCQTVRHGTTRVELNVSAKTAFKGISKANFVELHIPVPIDADKPTASANMGTVKYVPENGTVLWKLKSVQGAKEFLCRCEYTLPSVRATDPAATSKRPIAVKFEIPHFVASGLQVKFVTVTEVANYPIMPWVRYLTQAGEYQVRMS